MGKYPLYLGLAAILATGWGANAEEKSFHQEEAHVHGIGRLNVALEGNQLAIELISPAANIVGFEHEPENKAQEKAISDATSVLKDAAQVFALAPEAGCQLAKVDVATAMLDEEHHEEKHETESQGQRSHGHEEHDHEHHEEKHETKSQEQGSHGHEEHDEERHSEFHVTYEFQCLKPAELKFVDVLLFQRFPGTEELEAQVIGPDRQMARELTPDSARITF